MKRKVIFEMETSDPDDFLTLLWLSDHPDVELLAVVVTPGTEDQVKLARWALDHHKSGITPVPIGTTMGMTHPTFETKKCVSAFHYKVYGASPDEIPNHTTHDVTLGSFLVGKLLAAYDDVTYIVGCAPKCLAATFSEYPDVKLARWVQQGGFAGDNMVAPEHRLEKFAGKLTCPSFNPGGAPKLTCALLADQRITQKLFVSKNVCHGVVWTKDMHAQLYINMLRGWNRPTEEEAVSGKAVPPPPADWMSGLRPGLRTMVHGLECYLRDKGVGKAMHDLVAAACALDESVCTFRDATIFRDHGEWGAYAPGEGFQPGPPNARISVAVNMQRFVEVLAR